VECRKRIKVQLYRKIYLGFDLGGGAVRVLETLEVDRQHWGQLLYAELLRSALSLFAALASVVF
jgi:hypothetical protein